MAVVQRDPEIRERASDDANASTGMRHIALTRSRYICGASRDPSRPYKRATGIIDCIVCEELWWALSYDEREAIIDQHEAEGRIR